jgi:uncharacterized protein YxjI
MFPGSRLLVRQTFELAEFFGFETRNKYRISSEDGRDVGFAAEQGKGILGHLARYFLGHWRSFEILFFSADRQLVVSAFHPFRFYFHRLEVKDAQGNFLGLVERRFSLLSKCFDVRAPDGRTLMQVRSPIWRFWTFEFKDTTQNTLAFVRKKWTGLFAEGFTDKDTFLVDFVSPRIDEDARRLVVVASLFIDLMYFEKKARS